MPRKVRIARTIACKIEASGLSAFGYGDHILSHVAAKKALAEAWERLWLQSMRHSLEIGSGVPLRTSSNGFAAGATNTDAINRARGELIERASLLAAWRDVRGWKRISIHGFLGSFVTAAMRSRGWNADVFGIDARELGKTLVGFMSHREFGLVVDAKFIGFTPRSDRLTASFVLGLTRGVELLSSLDRGSLPFELDQQASPDDHLRYYADPERAMAIASLLETAGEGDVTLESPDRIETQVLYAAGSMPAIAVAWHPNWPELKWGRQSIVGVNPWPHPLA